MATKLTRLTHRLVIQLYLVAESCTICNCRFRWPVRKLLDTPSYLMKNWRFRVPVEITQRLPVFTQRRWCGWVTTAGLTRPSFLILFSCSRLRSADLISCSLHMLWWLVLQWGNVSQVSFQSLCSFIDRIRDYWYWFISRHLPIEFLRYGRMEMWRQCKTWLIDWLKPLFVIGRSGAQLSDWCISWFYSCSPECRGSTLR